MIEAMYVLIIGIILLGAGYLGYAGKFKGIAMLLGAVMFLGGAFYPGYGLWDDVFTTDGTTPATTTGYSFDITPANGSYDPGAANVCTQTVADDEESTVVQIDMDIGDDTFKANYTSFNFTIRPVAPTGSTNDDLVTIYFGIDETYEYGGEPVFYESSNVYQAVWSITDSETTENYEGSHTMLYTDQDWIELRCILDGKGSDTLGEELDSVGDEFTIPVKFWADNGWSWTYDIHFIVITAVA